MSSKYYYRPYGLDMEYEFETYQYVGRDYGNRKSANLGGIGNLSRYIRKKRNKRNKMYVLCDTYSDWKKHVEEILPSKTSCDYNNFTHWLYKNRNHEKMSLEIAKNVIVPLFIALFTMHEIIANDIVEYKLVVKSLAMSEELPIIEAVLNGNNAWGLISLIIIMFSVEIVSIVIMMKSIKKVEFYEDFIQIVEDIINT